MIYQSILLIHIIAGFLALLSGAVAIVSAKGGLSHRKTGTWYVVCMYIVGMSAVLMTISKANPFLFTVGVFTLYMTFTGRRAIFYYRLKEAYATGWREYLPIALAIVVALWMIVSPVYQMIQTGKISISVMAVFGGILMVFAVRDLMVVRRNPIFLPNDKSWLLRHIGMVSGAYIATLTAFLVTNISFNPPWVIWLGPTFVGSLLISLATRSWRKKLRLSA